SLEFRSEPFRIVHFLLTRSESAGTRLLCVVVIEIQDAWVSRRPIPCAFGVRCEFVAIAFEINLGSRRINLGSVGKRGCAHQAGGCRRGAVIAGAGRGGRWACLVQPLDAEQGAISVLHAPEPIQSPLDFVENVGETIARLGDASVIAEGIRALAISAEQD